jgi:uncharacterized protein (DUF2164 family)
MTIKLPDDAKQRMISSLKRFFEDQHGEEIGDLKAGLLLDFCLEEVCPTVYNRAIADAQAFITERAADLEGTCYEPEFSYWQK